MTYREKLQDVRWQKKRVEILTRDNWTCTNENCKATEGSFHVHHERYYGEPWECPNQFLKTICSRCHEKEHGISDLNRYAEPMQVGTVLKVSPGWKTELTETVFEYKEKPAEIIELRNKRERLQERLRGANEELTEQILTQIIGIDKLLKTG